MKLSFYGTINNERFNLAILRPCDTVANLQKVFGFDGFILANLNLQGGNQGRRMQI